MKSMNLTKNISDGGHVPCTKLEEPKGVEDLPKGIWFCAHSGCYSGSLNLMSSWMNCVPQKPNRSRLKYPFPSLVYVANTHMAYWKIKKRLAWAVRIMTRVSKVSITKFNQHSYIFITLH